jgi:hypothetical protein
VCVCVLWFCNCDSCVLGLGTSTAKEAKEYFSDMARHRIKFRYNGVSDDNSIELAFSKKKIEDRKDWLTKWMEVCKTCFRWVDV